ncbi:ABC transporter permease [Vibrio natriegens]|uniref:ABC transporter permease n=1 Tax=Vibrio natriegens NBRC 15636 = ATCC 14048 = DSM 759 TaxID=1219067 RepID=A0AAN0Y5V8_VIBNA|nr:ABC transporter permease [Vibrio natriegens]ALR18231.1 ABC transporter permease [Vibrio natriegens NBRC 15636 = ATCC 14048 = DSM 759]ANQ14178.1 ABC transporter permease [Vibrio natriegens NBRC 15636 = ATCC 14048 = DSM 759]EPM40214.1 ABC transporter permease [Vibrio natriegens NBRC 15636 = ATCC 14048 = DSM 759]MDX6028883.1 ABC transporter permease [Vibrio natriegens NBRC 15636 = ATCC 14048 = DSM 759]UUI14402.1 ABC transporter permease [Vibrio natriegens]
MLLRILRKRLYQLILVAWGVGTLTFVLMRSLPGDMAYLIAASRYGQDNVDSAAAELVRQELNLDQGWFSSYVSWLGDLLQLNLGNSLVSGLPVSEAVVHQLGHSMLLAGVGITLSVLIALPLGTWSAKKGGLVNSLVVWFSTFTRAMPVFVLGLLMILIFAISWKWFPVAGFGTWQHLVLPSITLAISLAAVSNRVVHNSVRSVLRSPFYIFSRVKGLNETQTFFRHGLRNMAVSIVAFVGIQLVSVIEGIIMIESLFSWPGVGHGLAHAIFARDIPVIQGCALTMGILFVLLNSIIDVLCYWIDPRGQQEK